MSDESKLALRSAKIARIIENISEMFNVSLQEATDIYYNSETANIQNSVEKMVKVGNNCYFCIKIDISKWKKYRKLST